MKFLNKVKMCTFLLSVFCIFVLTTCAVRTPIEQVSLSDVAQNLKYENIIFKKFTLAPHVNSNVPTPVPLIECRTSAISYLNKKDIFKRVKKVKETEIKLGKENQNPYDEPTLFVEAELIFLRIVSSAARIWGGIYPGRSAMKMNVKLMDASTDEVVAEKELVGAPNVFSSAFSYGDTDRNLPTKMGYLLGDFILANVSVR